MTDSSEHLFFSYWQSQVLENGYYLQSSTQSIKFYTERSLRREALLLGERLKEAAQTSKTLIYVAPFHEEIARRLDLSGAGHSLLWLAPATFSEVLPSFVIGDLDAWERSLREIKRGDSFLIYVHPAFKDDSIASFVKEGLSRSALRVKTIEHFSRIWEYNYRRNYERWLTLDDFSVLAKRPPPGTLVLGGPSVDDFFDEIRQSGPIWCADTALAPLVKRGLFPDLVFSIDAGHGSLEHFIAASPDGGLYKELRVVVDPLSFSGVMELPFAKVYTYGGSHPLIQASAHSFSALVNTSGDVKGAMVAALEALYPGAKTQIFGADGKHRKYVTHLRGSAYHSRGCFSITRLTPLENYFYNLSARYT